MAVTVSTIADPLGTKLVIDSDSDNSSEDNATGAVAGTIYAVEIDNTKNDVGVYTKLLDDSSATPGTSQAHWVLFAPASTKLTYVIASGLPFTGGLSFWTVISPYALTANSADSTTSPASDVSVKILCT